MRAEWEDWHSNEHMPERLSIPGFLRGSRWIATSGEPSYFVLYEAKDLSAITSGPYLERLNDPTPWSRKMMPHHRNMARTLCLVRQSRGGGLPHTLAKIPLAKPVRELPRGQGITAAHLLEAQPMPGQTLEQKIRGGDATAPWVLLVGGYDPDAVAASMPAVPGAGLYRLSYALSPRERS
jgi:hypothetical protein